MNWKHFSPILYTLPPGIALSSALYRIACHIWQVFLCVAVSSTITEVEHFIFIVHFAFNYGTSPAGTHPLTLLRPSWYNIATQIYHTNVYPKFICVGQSESAIRAARNCGRMGGGKPCTYCVGGWGGRTDASSLRNVSMCQKPLEYIQSSEWDMNKFVHPFPHIVCLHVAFCSVQCPKYVLKDNKKRALQREPKHYAERWHREIVFAFMVLSSGYLGVISMEIFFKIDYKI